MNRYDGIIFDFGDTLVKTPSLTDSLVSVFEHPKARDIGLQIEAKLVALYQPGQVEQPDWKELWQQSFNVFGAPFEKRIAHAHLNEFLKLCELHPYALSLLSKLHKLPIKIGLLSNVTGPSEVFSEALKTFGLHEYFDAIVWSSDIGFRKPSKQAYDITLDRLGISAERTLMVGDSELADIDGAQKSGLQSILLTSEMSKSTTANFKSTYQNAEEEIMKVLRG
jgi:putative hydrolase of the HAD superfamily